MITTARKAADPLTPAVIADLTEAERAVLFMDIVVAAAWSREWTADDTLRITTRGGHAVSPSKMLSATRTAMLTDLAGYVALHAGGVTVASTASVLTWSAADLLRGYVLKRIGRDTAHAADGGYVMDEDPLASPRVSDYEDTVYRLRRLVDAGLVGGVQQVFRFAHGAVDAVSPWMGTSTDTPTTLRWRPVCVRERLVAHTADSLERMMQRHLCTGDDLCADVTDAAFRDAMTRALHLVHGTDPDATAVWNSSWQLLKSGTITPPRGAFDDIAPLWDTHHDLWRKAYGLAAVPHQAAWGHRSHGTTTLAELASYTAVDTRQIVDAITTKDRTYP